MLPLRLHLENFGSFRVPTTVDLHDVDYFVLVGPTGAGKSTIIDAICFALYGTVPRWGKENVIAFALAPSATSGKVALVFEVAGRRYGIVRVLARNAKGVVGTKEARLDELDPAVGPAAGIEELLAAVVRQVAEGDQVTAATQRLTGLEYRFFTQCVILPQGRFAEFLHGVPSKRQELLVQLLDAEVYEQIRRRAVEEEAQARTTGQFLRQQLYELSDADEAAETAARERRDALRMLQDQVREGIEELRRQDSENARLAADRKSKDEALGLLSSVTMPREVPTLAEARRAATEEADRLADEATRLDAAETEAESTLAALGDKAELQRAEEAHREHQQLTQDLATTRTALKDARKAAGVAGDRAERAAVALHQAEALRQHSRDTHAAVDLARRLVVGEPCPVCLRKVTESPRHPEPFGLADAERYVAQRQRELDDATKAHREADRSVERKEQQCSDLEKRLAAEVERIRTHPDLNALRSRLAELEPAATAIENARQEARKARKARNAAVGRADDARRTVDAALRGLDSARDTVAAYGPPALDRTDLHAAWTALLTWCEQQRQAVQEQADAISSQLAQARRSADDLRAGLRDLLHTRDVPLPAALEADLIAGAVAEATGRAGTQLELVRENRKNAATLAEQIRTQEHAEKVAHELALRLRANNFEKWLCSEALELLVTVASDTLRTLSEGQFELVLSDRSDIEVVDYAEAGMRRNVRTLSGGETFQASLALALALSDQIARLAAGAARSLDSIFLDEGFGTLDPATLETVASTLERLAGDGGRMVGIVTHVPALAERVPVRFEVMRDASGSHLEKKPT